MALGGQPNELREFINRVAPRTRRIGIVCAFLIPVTGVVNLAAVARKHNYQLPSEFDAIVAVKLVLLAVMAAMLIRASRLRGSAPPELRSEARRLSFAAGVIAACGTVALLLGLWLSGL